jgi:hypothetical protein
MRHFLPLTFCALVVAGAIYLADNGHHNYIHQLTIQNAKTAALKAKVGIQAELAAYKQAEATEAKLTAAEKGCQNGLVAYSVLTTTQIQKNHVVKPDCSVE